MRAHHVSLWILFAAAGLMALSGCSKKKKKTTPKTPGAKAEARGAKAEARASGSGGSATVPSGVSSGKEDDAKEMPSRPSGGGSEAGSGQQQGGGAAPGAARPSGGSQAGGSGASGGGGSATTTTPKVNPEEVKRRNLAAAKKALGAGNLDRAIALAKAVLAVDEKNVDAMVVIARAYFKQGKLEFCRAVLGFIAGIDPNNAHGYYLAGHLALHDNEFARARRFFEKAVERNPNFPDAWAILCAWYSKGKNWRDPKRPGKDAYTACTKATALRTWDWKSMLNLGTVYRGLAVDCRGSGVRACEMQRRSCGASQQCQSAYDSCRKGVIARCRPTELRYNKMAKEAYLRASDLYQKALRSHGKPASPYAPALFNLGVLYLDAQAMPGEGVISRLNKAKAYLRHYLRAAKPRTARKEQDTVRALLKRADMLIQAEKAKEEARKAQEAAARQARHGG